jgi:release factor glutamine methyltransferase
VTFVLVQPAVSPTLYQLVVIARERLVRAGIPPDQAGIDAEVLARHVVGWDRATYLADRDMPVAGAHRDAYLALIARRERREPVAYITGHREFWGLDFLVSPAVLIPRPETEFIVEAALARLADRERAWTIADVGTGSGCLAIALAHDLPHAAVTATDVSDDALCVARRNADRLGVAGRVTFVRTPMLEDVDGPFELIVSNPPYVPRVQQSALSPDVRDHEPDVALFGAGDDGLDLTRTLLSQAPDRLTSSGLLMIEFGYGQRRLVEEAVAPIDRLQVVEVLRDLQGHERTLVARRMP